MNDLQRALDGASRARNVLTDAVDRIATRQCKQRTNYQRKRYETRQHIDLDTKNRKSLRRLHYPGSLAIDAPNAQNPDSFD
ncbi:hypothetical protein [Pandoraea sputorum]|uniref:hypothetical protein n=1 Tax=Pandoraea sputorum TaxID=93222 RepID=UPI001780EB2D|nr:hypothetical protein [Pandoraea sputorum]